MHGTTFSFLPFCLNWQPFWSTTTTTTSLSLHLSRVFERVTQTNCTIYVNTYERTTRVVAWNESHWKLVEAGNVDARLTTFITRRRRRLPAKKKKEKKALNEMVKKWRKPLVTRNTHKKHRPTLSQINPLILRLHHHIRTGDEEKKSSSARLPFTPLGVKCGAIYSSSSYYYYY